MKTATNFNVSPHRNSKLFIEGTATGSNASIEMSPGRLGAIDIDIPSKTAKTTKNAGAPDAEKKKKKMKLEDLIFDQKYHEFRNTQGSTYFRQSHNGSQRYSELRTHLDININHSTLSPPQFK